MPKLRPTKIATRFASISPFYYIQDSAEPWKKDGLPPCVLKLELNWSRFVSKPYVVIISILTGLSRIGYVVNYSLNRYFN